MTTTNWPDPTRPGVPMFPERDGWHMLDRDVWQWSAKRKAWNDTVLHPNFVLPKNMAWRKYYGPVLTPTQINEMLAAERERCSKTCEAEERARTECAADTRRLDWLEKLPFADVGRLPNGWEICINNVRHWDVQPTLREAIDAAMEGGNG